MYWFKGFLASLPLFLLFACSSSLEYSLEAIEDGDYQSARKYLLQYCDKYSIEYLVYRDSGSGRSFVDVLEKLGSKEVLNEVYQRKFSRENTFFLAGEAFSWRLLQLAEKWQDIKLLNAMSQRIEKEYPIVKADNYSKGYNSLIKSASLYLSANKQSIAGLSVYWSQKKYFKNRQGFKGIWEEAYKKKAQSVLNVLSSSLGKSVLAHQKRVVENTDLKDLDFIFTVEKSAIDKTPFSVLRSAMSEFTSRSHERQQVALNSLKTLKPDLVKSSANLNKLEMQRDGLKEANDYTFEERKECGRCDGKSYLNCRGCRGSGRCLHCNQGLISCYSCNGHGHIQCRHCHGHGCYYGYERVHHHDGHGHHCDKVRVRRSCHSCHGHGQISCSSCNHGRIFCRTCQGSDRCHSCSGSGRKDCPGCRNGTILVTLKTTKGIEVDRLISTAERLYSSLKNQIAQKEYTIQWERRRKQILERFAKGDD